MLSNQQTDLWKRIRDFSIDDPSAIVKYSDKLARNNGWPEHYTSRVIEEYKKFIFLCCVLPGGASPSKPIDEAWHLHLTYTKNYWKELCEDILGKAIHHFPSKGGPDENRKHADWYIETLNAYLDLFGYEPPDDIWFQPPKPTPLQFEAKSNWTYRSAYHKYLYVLIAPFVLIEVLYNELNPFNLSGLHFLLFYGTLAASVTIYFILIARIKSKEISTLIHNYYEGDADLYQLARFIYSREHSFRAAIVDLVGRKVLEPYGRSLFKFHAAAYQHSPFEKNPLIGNLQKNVQDGELVHFGNLSVYYDEENTYHEGLHRLSESVKFKDNIPLVAGIALGLIGVVRIGQGIYNHHSTGFLFVMLFLFIVLVRYINNMISAAGILRDEFRSAFKSSGNEEFATTALAGAFVFFGLSSISHIDGYNRLQNTFYKHRMSYGDGYSGGCGGSGCGSGCGGGGCGGGCGGCGGS